ncbi:MAG TPA: DUF4149 domain-containing protein [Rhodocyclaceae bacterium]|nr:DUF4149 domain-containing protein [Rhodocyclaceae bacterium]
MKKLADALYSICIAVWVGAMVGVGYVAVPVLFAHLADRAVAGYLGGHMFAVGGWLGLACGLYLLAYLFAVHRRAALSNPATCLVAVMLVLGAFGQFVAQPAIIALRDQVLPLSVMQTPLAGAFARWHALSGALYLLQVLLGFALVLKQQRGRRDAA